ncbi:MAG: pseudouridylate synthase [Betaproteobacteria bacterium HGW-Betaproteobacteria-13]|nr:MAG: pseudouridylate synthase [Betaproteobacteria bacterium HGW-Betaproteobacteria-13]
MLDILYRDDHLIAIHKPSGLLVHRTGLDAREERFAVQLLRDQIGRHVHPAHRLDKGTSGVLLFALDRDTAARAGALFENAADVIDHPLVRRFDPAERRSARADTLPQAAITRYRRLATTELPYQVDRYPSSRYALLELQPETGRRHQLRRHLKHISHPIIGDATFGKGRHNRLFQTLFGSDRLLLACTGLAFRHPLSDTPLQIDCPLTPDFTNVLTALGWHLRADGLSATGDS